MPYQPIYSSFLIDYHKTSHITRSALSTPKGNQAQFPRVKSILQVGADPSLELRGVNPMRGAVFKTCSVLFNFCLFLYYFFSLLFFNVL